MKLEFCLVTFKLSSALGFILWFNHLEKNDSEKNKPYGHSQLKMNE